jgi:rare lipoprotein A
MFNFQRFAVIFCVALVTACSSQPSIKEGADTRASKQPAQTPAGKGGYYLDDGPGDNPPADIDSIPDAQLKTETPLVSPNKPYTALGKKYVPMTSYAPYYQQGIASWYGKRYHGKKTSSGEVYDMYGMTGAHPTLPIPSYVRVTNPLNKRSVIVRINDRGPFKHDRLIDLSYAAAYKLRITSRGSGPVEVEWIDTRPEALRKMNTTPAATLASTTNITPVAYKETPAATAAPAPAPANNMEPRATSYYVQVGAFKNELNGDQLQKKILGLELAGDAAVTNVYNDGIYRVKLGPFGSRKEADVSANKVRKQLNLSAIVTNQ